MVLPSIKYITDIDLTITSVNMILLCKYDFSTKPYHRVSYSDLGLTDH